MVSFPGESVRTEAGRDIPEHLPNEPQPAGVQGWRLWLRVAATAVLIKILFALTTPLWPLYGLFALVYGRAPNVPRLRQAKRYLVNIWTAPAALGWHTPARRWWLTLTILRGVATSPVVGLAWYLDEILFGRRLNAVTLAAPLFEVSAARSGSTQLARYLESDPKLVAPTLLQAVFPYRWLWLLCGATVGRLVSREWLQHRVEANIPPAFLERHEGELFLTDTYEVALFTAHFNATCFFFGPEFARVEFGAGELNVHNRELWELDFVALMERTGRKVMLNHPQDGKGKRLFVKGHFLAAVPALVRRFPDARFLTIVRNPEKRLQSSVNYMRANPFDSTLGPPPWAWLADTLSHTEAAYNLAEMAWQSGSEGEHRCLVRFDDYVRDLSGTMRHIYDELGLGTVPPHVPTEHPPRRRGSYLLDRSLEQCGVNHAAFTASMAEYSRWSASAQPR